MAHNTNEESKKQVKNYFPPSIMAIIEREKREYESYNDTVCRIIAEFEKLTQERPTYTQILGYLNGQQIQPHPQPSQQPLQKASKPRITNEVRILEVLKGTMNIYEIVNATGISPDECNQALLSLKKQKLIRKIGVDEYRKEE